MPDVLTDALNSPAGKLADILLKKLTREVDGKLPDDVQARLDRLVDMSGTAGLLARARLAVEVPLLFDRAPEWTKRKMLPIFDWSSSDAASAWASRKYSRWIGTPELFRLLKTPFMEIFERNDVPAEDMRVFADWVAAILIANQSDVAAYPLTGPEARGLLRRAGPGAMASVGHRLAMEMERTKPEEKSAKWQKVIGPVFRMVWPLDVELQTSATTFKLVQLVRATGDAFSDAADTVMPFIRAEETHAHTTIFSISQAPVELYKMAPAKMLDLLAAVVGDAPQGSVFSLGTALNRLREIEPSLADTRKFQKLLSSASPHVL